MAVDRLSRAFPTFIRMGKGLFRAARWMVKPALILVLVLVIAHSAATFILGRRVQARIAEIKARGEPVTFADLNKPPIPHDRNAAFVYMKAFKIVSNQEAAADVEKVWDLLTSKDSSKLDEAERILSKYQGAIALVHQAQSLPACRFPIEPALEIDPRVTVRLKRLAFLLRESALVKARNGRMDEALTDVESSCRVSDALKDEPLLTPQLVRMAIVMQSASCFEQVARYGTIDYRQAKRLFDALSGLGVGPDFLRTVQAERACGFWLFEHVRTDPDGLSDLAYCDDEQSRDAYRLVGSRLWRPVLYADELVFTDSMTRAVRLAGMTYRELAAKKVELDDESGLRWWTAVSVFQLPVFSHSRMRADEADAYAAGTRVMLAILAYKDRYGAYPASLQDVKAKLGWKLPIDPFSGGDFIYKRQGKGFLLYSIGPDLKDDGGAEPSTPVRDVDETGDIVWKMGGEG